MIFHTAAYIRVSREDGDKEESNSIRNQRTFLMNYILAKEDLHLYHIYVDDGYSGTNFHRPGFQQMIAEIEHGRVNCVIVKDLSRFGRDYLDTGNYLERYFPAWGVRFIAINDHIDSIHQAYDLLIPIKNIFNEQYSRDISKKIRSTLHAKQQSGEFIGAFACYGYQKSPSDRNKLIIDPYAADIVRRIFSLYLHGYGKKKIAKILNSEGVLCPFEYKRANGAHYQNFYGSGHSVSWSYSSINCILHREMYIGNMVQGTKRQTLCGRQQKIAKEDWIIVPNTHEAIIDLDTWERTQRMLTTKMQPSSTKPSQNIFSGLLKCSTCKKAMVRTSWELANGIKRCCFYCGTYKRKGKNHCSPHAIPLEKLEDIVAEELLKHYDIRTLTREILFETIAEIIIHEDQTITITYRF
jgi:DNA invertase Pin-like site-specific DNA recombinase